MENVSSLSKTQLSQRLTAHHGSNSASATPTAVPSPTTAEVIPMASSIENDVGGNEHLPTVAQALTGSEPLHSNSSPNEETNNVQPTAVGATAPQLAQLDDIGLQVLQQLAEQEAITLDRIQEVVDGYRDPLFSKEASILTFQQHFSMFSNLKSLGESQKVLLVNLHGILHDAKIRAAGGGAGGRVNTSAAADDASHGSQHYPGGAGNSVNPTHHPLHDRSESTDTITSMDSMVDKAHAAVGSASAGASGGGIIDTSFDAAYAMEGVVDKFFLHPSMMHFVAEHLMFSLHYCRSIAPTLLDMIYNKEAATKMTKFIEYSREISARVTFSNTFLPEHDLLGAKQEELKQRTPVEELAMLMSTALASLRRYLHAARCICEAEDCLSIADREELLEGFVKPVTQRLAEERHMVRECISTHTARLLVSKMDDFTAPQNESRVLLHHGKLVKKFARGRHERLALLFSDVFCYVEEQGNGRWRVRGLMALESKLELRDVEDCYFQQLSNCFEIQIPTGKKYVFFAYSATEKREWLLQIDSAMNNCMKRKADAMSGNVGDAAHSPTTIATVAAAGGSDVFFRRAPATATEGRRVVGPRSRLERQRREDNRRIAMQQAGMLHTMSFMSSASGGGVGGGGGGRPTHPTQADLSSIGSQADSTCGTPKSTKSMSRRSLRASYNSSAWSTQRPIAHVRVKSMDLLAGGGAAAADATPAPDTPVPMGHIPKPVHSRQNSMTPSGFHNTPTPGGGSATSNPAILPVVHSRVASSPASPSTNNMFDIRQHQHVANATPALSLTPTNAAVVAATATPTSFGNMQSSKSPADGGNSAADLLGENQSIVFSGSFAPPATTLTNSTNATGSSGSGTTTRESTTLFSQSQQQSVLVETHPSTAVAAALQAPIARSHAGPAAGVPSSAASSGTGAPLVGLETKTLSPVTSSIGGGNGSSLSALDMAFGATMMTPSGDATSGLQRRQSAPPVTAGFTSVQNAVAQSSSSATPLAEAISPPAPQQHVDPQVPLPPALQLDQVSNGTPQIMVSNSSMALSQNPSLGSPSMLSATQRPSVDHSAVAAVIAPAAETNNLLGGSTVAGPSGSNTPGGGPSSVSSIGGTTPVATDTVNSTTGVLSVSGASQQPSPPPPGNSGTTSNASPSEEAST